MDLAVLLTYTAGTNITRYALKADSVTISIAKTPIQIPVPQNTPQLVDFGIFRPAITVSAIVDNVGEGTSLVDGVEGMQAVVIGGFTTYYIPYKNKLEEALYTWIADETNTLVLTVGDTTRPVYNRSADGSEADETGGTLFHATGGSEYEVALQQARFQMDAGREDRWICQMQFVAAARRDAAAEVSGVF